MNVNNMMININLNQKTVLAICASLGSLVLLTLAYAGWQWRNDWIAAHQEVSVKQAIVGPDETLVMIAAIPNAHLFGKAFSKVGQVPITNLQLQVTGIVKTLTEHGGPQSKAYISISGQPSKIYLIGDSLPYGVKVYDIAADAIILENKGHLEKLLLPRQQLNFKSRNVKERL